MISGRTTRVMLDATELQGRVTSQGRSMSAPAGSLSLEAYISG
jgi:hypothetical protein